MSVFGSIMSKIFGHGTGAQPASAQPASTASSSAQPGAAPGAPPTQATPAQAASGPAQTAAAQTAAPQQPVDVEAVLNDMATQSSQKLDWRHSIVDLMKLLGLDSSLDERKKLAGELGYTGDTNNSATMNIWLHKQVMQKLAENGGKVPADLRS